MRFGDDPVSGCDLSSLRLLGTVGEPINPEAWRWYYEVVGGGKCPVVDTWWQTETGGHMILPLPGAWPEKPGSATLPFFGVQPVVLDEQGADWLTGWRMCGCSLTDCEVECGNVLLLPWAQHQALCVCVLCTFCVCVLDALYLWMRTNSYGRAWCTQATSCRVRQRATSASAPPGPR